jgi:HAD superfamily hydrolase (TIGR01509 family)
VKLFISHAVIDKHLAIAFKELIENTTMGLANVWLSSAIDGLKPGDNLWNEVHQHLSDSDKIIALLTPNSLQRPWVLYESGYVAGNRKANVIPIVFSLAKDDLPLPLSAYVIYSGDDENDLVQFLMQIMGEIVPLPNTTLIQSGTKDFLKNISSIKKNLDILAEERRKKTDGVTQKESVQVIEKLKASEIFHQKLADAAISNITIIGYTNEVESGTIDHYRVKGKKVIEIFKRSMIDDLRQQQAINLKRIKDSEEVSLWNKRGKIIESTIKLEEEFEDDSDVSIKHYFYSSPPITRAYIFDNREAIVSFYEVCEDVVNSRKSIYKGMGNSKSIWINNETEYGKQLLQGLNEEVKSLRINSRSWSEENFLIKNPQVGVGISMMPVLELKYAFFDLDGVLYDTMPYYVEAWKKGFNVVDVLIEDIDAYEQESRSSRTTVIELFKKYLKRLPTENEVKLVIDEKNKILQQLGKPPIIEGATELIEQVVSSDIGVYIVTSSKRENLIEELTDDFKGFILASNIISGNDIKFGKPNPEPYLLACEKAECSPTETIVFENSPLGITAARRAGINCIAINSGLLDDSILESHGAIVVFNNIKDVLERWADIKKSFVQ